MTLAIDLTEKQIGTALVAFLMTIVPEDVEIVKGQVNRVPSPKGDNYIVYWPGMRRRLATNTVTPATDDVLYNLNTYMEPTELSVQIDVHGPISADYAQMITTVWRSEYATEFFDARPEAVQVLTADDPRQLAFETGEKQIEDRWSIAALLQVNPVVTTVQQFADAVEIGLVEIDTVYPPGAP